MKPKCTLSQEKRFDPQFFIFTVFPEKTDLSSQHSTVRENRSEIEFTVRLLPAVVANVAIYKK
jgi:hypothetical protein